MHEGFDISLARGGKHAYCFFKERDDVSPGGGQHVGGHCTHLLSSEVRREVNVYTTEDGQQMNSPTANTNISAQLEGLCPQSTKSNVSVFLVLKLHT